MRNYSIPAVAVAAVVTIPIAAHAVTVDFSWTGSKGGTVSGYLVFANPNGEQTPTSVTVTSAPTPLPAPYSFSIQNDTHTGAFTLSNGVVKAAFYSIQHVSRSIHPSRTFFSDSFKLTGLDLNRIVGKNYYEVAVVTYAYLNGFVDYTFNSSGFAGLTFTTVDVPEPSTIVLLGAGLAGISMFRRRRPRVSLGGLAPVAAASVT